MDQYGLVKNYFSVLPDLTFGRAAAAFRSLF